ncbi:MAG: phosphotransferase [Legionella sp.]|uniref:aminoglycoside phosphotransferase family protein n=1 Tax=Legionella sp. TaxID=459 RepID=UPI0039E636C3
MHERENALKEWLTKTIKCSEFEIKLLAGDASFRRYFRIQHKDSSYVIMDAPPGKEDLMPFIHIAQALEQVNVLTPKILAQDLQQGFLLLNDLGDNLLLNALCAETADNYYKETIKTLLKIQSCTINDPKLASFDHAFMMHEMKLCIDWFLCNYLALELSAPEISLLQQSMDWIATEVAKQPLTFIHRDYHSRNLMILNQPPELLMGVIDFQDAMCGPLTYDLVSLLKDCYIAWPRAKILEWVELFYEQNSLASMYTLPEFIRAFDLCGLQRHLKVLGIFCRLHLRDNKSGYLKDLPLTLSYVLECVETYEELHSLFNFFQMRVYLP